MSENIIQYVTAAGNGDTDAMAKLYSRTLKASYFLAATLCGDKQAAADIAKKAYARAFCNVDKLKKPEAFEIWMKQNVAAVYKETQKFVFADADAGAVENSSEFLAESILDDAEMSAKIIEAVTDLRPELKTALVLHYNNGMPVQILAKFLGVSESTANALLGKARASVLATVGIDSSSDAVSGTLPVLTRLFQRKAVELSIDNSDVRDIFIYAIDAFEASKPAVPAEEEPVEEDKPAEQEEAPTVEEPVDEASEKEETAEEIVEEEPVKAPDNILMFKQRISDILGSEDVSSENEEISSNAQEESHNDDETEEITAPDISVSESVPNSAIAEFGGISIDDNDGPTSVIEAPAKSEKEKFDIKKLNPKMILIACVALVVVILAIVGISKLAGKDDSGSGTNVSQGEDAYSWRAGGFSECTEIGYLDENAAYFKSATTGKYGLIDYQGNVILQPNYDGFERCGSGREYTDRDSYHSLVLIGNEKFELTIENGVVTIAENAHLPHSVSTEELEGTSYDERDRYFEGYAAARKNGKWGYVSQEKDKKVIPYEYDAVNDLPASETAKSDYCRPVTDGLIAVKKDGKMGIINLDNDVIAPFEYSNIMPGSNGVFIACKDGVWGVILTGDAKNTFSGVNIIVETLPPEVPSTENANEDILGKYKVTSDDGANVRDGAGSDYDLLGELDYGDVVIGYSTKTADNGNKWLKIKFNGEYGWVAMNMLESVD